VTKASDNAYPSVLITEGTIPASPAAGKQRQWIDSTTKQLKVVSSAGTQTVGTGLKLIGCKVWNSTTQTMNGSGTNGGNTLITFDSEEWDSDGFHSTSSNTSRITIPTGFGGKYAVGYMVWLGTSAAGTLIDMYVNGAIATHHGMRFQTIDVGTMTMNGHGIANLAAADYIELQLNNPSASTITIGHASAQVVQTAFWATLLGV
jgi:hypothetical protein